MKRMRRLDRLSWLRLPRLSGLDDKAQRCAAHTKTESPQRHYATLLADAKRQRLTPNAPRPKEVGSYHGIASTRRGRVRIVRT